MALKTQAQPFSHSASNCLRVAGGSTNSLSRLRFGFSPSVVRKSVQRERMLPAMCFTMIAIELASGSSDGEELLIGDLLHGALGKLLVVAEEGQRVADVGCGEFKRHGEILSGRAWLA